MNALDKIFEDWWLCKPSGVVLPAAHLEKVIDCVRARLRGPSPGGTQHDAEALLLPVSSSDDSLPLVQMLGCRTGDSLQAGRAVIDFLRFWQALSEVWRRLRPLEELDDEPIADEINTFRDVLLRRFDHLGVAGDWLVEWVCAARNMSADVDAWSSLEAAVNQVAVALKANPGSKTFLQLDELAALLVPWLQELVEDYCRGSRSAMVFCVREVANCRRHDACLHLGSSRWDVEGALHSLCTIGSNRAAARGSAWSSGGAKLRRNEVDCPICMVPYVEGAESVMTHCCFQVLCAACHGRLTDAGGHLTCPFCRAVELIPKHKDKHSSEPRGARPRRAHGVAPRAPATAARRPPPPPPPPIQPARRPPRTSPGATHRVAIGRSWAWSGNLRQLLPVCLLVTAYAACSMCTGGAHL